MSDNLSPLVGRTVLVAGLGNIGSPLAALLLQAGVSRLRLVDRDVVEPKNLIAQDFRPEDVGRPKADALRDRLRVRFPDRDVQSWGVDLEDMPVGVADVDLVFGALDSRRARQVLIDDTAWPLGVSVIDGGVGDGHIGRVQVFRPGPETACLECTWGDADYRLASREYPCRPGSRPESMPTGAPAYLGTFTASLMVREAVRLLTVPLAPVLGGEGLGVRGSSVAQSLPLTPDPSPPEYRGRGEHLAGEKESYEIPFDLDHLVLRRYALRRSARCRFDHAIRPRGDGWENKSVANAPGSWKRP